MRIGDFTVVEQMGYARGRRDLRARRGDDMVWIRLADPPTLFADAQSPFFQMQRLCFDADVPGCLVQWEAEVLARLDHPGIPAVVASGTLDGAFWFARRWVDGQSLNTVEAPDWQATTEALLAILAYLESMQVVHRDLAPDNILVTPDGPRLIDFELATLEGKGVIGRVGRRRFTPPEIIARRLGASNAPVGNRDLFALGCILQQATLASATPLHRLREALTAPPGQRPATVEEARTLLIDAIAPAQRATPPGDVLTALRGGDVRQALHHAQQTADAAAEAAIATELGEIDIALDALARARSVHGPTAELFVVEASLRLQLASNPGGIAALDAAAARARSPMLTERLASGYLAAGEPRSAMSWAILSGDTLTRMMIGRMIVQLSQHPPVPFAHAIITGCVATGLRAIFTQSLSRVRRWFSAAVDAARLTMPTHQLGPHSIVIATAGMALAAPWARPLVTALQHDAAGLAAVERIIGPLPVSYATLPFLAAHLLGLRELAHQLAHIPGLTQCFPGGRAPDWALEAPAPSR